MLLQPFTEEFEASPGFQAQDETPHTTVQAQMLDTTFLQLPKPSFSYMISIKGFVGMVVRGVDQMCLP